MRGFIFLIEVAIAGFMIALVFAAFLATTTVKLQWQRTELIDLGSSALWVLSASDSAEWLNASTVAMINGLLPPHVRWALLVSGTPKPRIAVGCEGTYTQCAELGKDLVSASLNNRTITFDVEQLTDFSTATLERYDVLVFLTMPADGFDGNASIQEWLGHGRSLLAVLDMTEDTYEQMDATFGFSKVAPSTSATIAFTRYEPARNTIQKYFLGLGMPVDTPDEVNAKRTGTWWLWERDRQVNITADTVEIQNITEPARISVAPRQPFNLTGPDGQNHTFYVKELRWPDSVVFAVNETQFVFKNFIYGEFGVSSALDIISDGTSAAASVNRSAVWISAFPASDEYRLLLRAAIASLVSEWWLAEPIRPREFVTVSAFGVLCCDVPEPVQLVLWLWHAW